MKKKIRFYKCLLIEIIETLCTICMIECEQRQAPSKYRHIMADHFGQLKNFSEQLRKEMSNEKK